MPFIKPSRRNVIAKHGLDGLAVIEVGDLCYVHYKNMIDRWKLNPKWTTAHEIYKEWFVVHKEPENPNQATAARLAWEVFFIMHVIPYEHQKRFENGDIL